MSEALQIHVQADDYGNHNAREKANHFDKKVTVTERVVIIANFILELPSAAFDQLSSVQKPQFALVSMLISFTVLTISIVELVYKGRKERVTLKNKGLIPWFYYPYPNSRPLGSFSGIIGLVCSIFQCIFATITYAFLSGHSDNPIKVSIWPIIFAFGLLYSRLSESYYAQGKFNLTPFARRLNRAEEFTLLDLAAASNNFSVQNKLGEGLFGDIYIGKLSDGREVAINRVITEQRSKSEEEIRAFESELTYLSRLHHKHLVSLIGYCEEEKEILLVFPYYKNGALYNQLHDENYIQKNGIVLKSWKMRIKIALEVARGIEYLHNYAFPSIVHGNIRSGNIFLEENWTARVFDFGFSSLCPVSEFDNRLKKESASTIGCKDPEYYSRNVVTTKTDVYSFGVLLLELLTGKKTIFDDFDNGGIPTSVVDFAVPKILGHEFNKIFDRRMDPPESANEIEAVKMVAYTALHCVNPDGNNRPNITCVVANLEQALSLNDYRRA